MSIKDISWNEGEGIGLIKDRVRALSALARSIHVLFDDGTERPADLARVLEDELLDVEAALDRFYCDHVPIKEVENG